MRLKNPRNIVNKKVNEALIITKSRIFYTKIYFSCLSNWFGKYENYPLPLRVGAQC